MTHHQRTLTHWRIALVAVLTSLALAASDNATAADQRRGAECAALDDPTARLACFDAAFPRAARTAPPKPSAVAVATVDPASEARKFGLSPAQINVIEKKPNQPPLAATAAAVKTVRRLPSGHLLIGLDSDQVWEQTEIDSHIWLEPGDRVTIRRAALDSFLLDTPGHFSTRVRRVQ